MQLPASSIFSQKKNVFPSLLYRSTPSDTNMSSTMSDIYNKWSIQLWLRINWDHSTASNWFSDPSFEMSAASHGKSDGVDKIITFSPRCIVAILFIWSCFTSIWKNKTFRIKTNLPDFNNIFINNLKGVYFFKWIFFKYFLLKIYIFI